MDEELKNSEGTEEENKNAISSDLIRGHINTIILRTLYERDKYGYEIIEEIEAKSHGQYSLKQPTLYSALKRLESQGYITAYWKTDEISNGGRRKYYTLTDSGREITEKNQAEWEYSRTVIDSLISDRNFDFSQPAPNPVDFKILKTSTSRVPNIKDDDEEIKEVREVKYEEEKIDSEQKENVEPAPVSVSETVVTETQTSQLESVQSEILIDSVVQQITQQVVEQLQQAVQPIQAQTNVVNEVSEQPAPAVQSLQQSAQEPQNDEQRIHENYLKLISEPITETQETPPVPYADNINTEKLIYITKPETERDYKNLINNLFVKTVQPHQQTEPVNPIQQVPVQVSYEDASVKASKDGLTVNSSEYVVSGSRRKKFNRGITLFKCSLIVAVILLFEFALSLAFHTSLDVGIGYPFVILAIAVAQLAIFGILTTTDFGKSTRKPTSHSYLTASVVLAIILILIIFVASLLFDVKFSVASSVLALIIIPSLVVLNIPIFSTIYYLFSK